MNVNNEGKIKRVNFMHNKNSLESMPVYIESDRRNLYVFFVFELGMVYFIYYAYFNSDKNNIVEGILYLTVVSLLVVSLLVYLLKQGTFILSANENGVFYKTSAKHEEFILLEWSSIHEIKYSFYDGDCFLDIIFGVKNQEMPTPCNAEVSRLGCSKGLKISFTLKGIEAYVKKHDPKTELDNLRVKSGKAKFL